MSTRSSFRRSASRVLVLAGILSAPVGLVTVLYPPSVDPEVLGYPFHHATHVVVAISLVVLHLMKAYGFVGLSRLDGGGPVTRWSMLAAALGFAVVATCEGFSGAMWGVPLDTPAAVDLNNAYGAGSMLLAVASMVGGTVIIRRKLLPGWGRWSVLLSGAFMIFVVTPALIMGRGPLAYLTLTGWSLFYIWIGRALGRATENSSSA